MTACRACLVERDDDLFISASGKHYDRCRPCRSARSLKWKRAHPELNRERAIDWQRNNPEKARARGRAYYARHRDAEQIRSRKEHRAARKVENQRNYWFKKAYGISRADYEQMVEKQGGRCAICGGLPTVGRQQRLAVDHDHQTGIVRGLLCFRCNIGLGHLNDDPNLLKAAASYLGRSAGASAVGRVA